MAVILDLILIGLAIALDPLPLTAFFVVLPSKGGTRKGAAFVFGWLVSLAIVVSVTVLATGNNPPKPNTAPTLQPWGLIGAGAATVVEAKLSSWESYLALFLFCLLASSTYLAMEIYAVLRYEQSQAFLNRVREWIDMHTDQVIIIGGLIIGFWLIGNSLYLITG